MSECADIAVVILAAGRAKRFGSDKLMAPLNGLPVGLHIVQSVADMNFGWRFAICAADAPIAEHYVSAGFVVIINADPDQGQARSLHLAVQAVELTKAAALLVLLADMPFITRQHLDAITGNSVLCASTDGNTPMPPALFPRSMWPDLLSAQGDRGARHLLRGAHLVRAPAAILWDIDVEADLHTPGTS